jgi:hypothetical protein
LFDVDARNDEYVAKMDGYNAAFDAYEGQLAEYAAAKAMRDGLLGKPVNADGVVKDAVGAPNPGENIDAGPLVLSQNQFVLVMKL